MLIIISCTLLLIIGSVNASNEYMEDTADDNSDYHITTQNDEHEIIKEDENFKDKDNPTIKTLNNNLSNNVKQLKSSEGMVIYPDDFYEIYKELSYNIKYPLIYYNLSRDDDKNSVLDVNLYYTPESRSLSNAKVYLRDDKNNTIGINTTNSSGDCRFIVNKTRTDQTVTICYDGDGDILPNTESLTINGISLIYPTIRLYNVNASYSEIYNSYGTKYFKVNQTFIIEAITYDSSLRFADGNVTIILNNKTFIKQEIRGPIIRVEVNSSKFGFNTAEIHIEYDSKEAFKSCEFYITELSTKINITSSKFIVNKTNKITIDVYDELDRRVPSGFVNVKVNNVYLTDNNGRINNYNVENGKCIVYYTTPLELKYKVNELTVIFNPTYAYHSSQETIKFIPYPRNASMIVKTNRQTAQMGEMVTFSVEIYAYGTQYVYGIGKVIKYASDKTIKSVNPYYDLSGANFNSYSYEEDYMLMLNEGVVIFKINGVTIRDEKGEPIKTNVTYNRASLNFTIPDGWSAKPIKITAVYSNKYFDRVENKTYMNLTKIETQIDYKKVKYSNNTLKIEAQIHDIHNHTVLGRNILAVKINGITIKRTVTRPQYYTVQNGMIKLEIKVDSKYLRHGENTIQIVTGDRNAYLGCRKDYRIRI